MSLVLILQHAACETPGTIGDALDAKGIDARYVRVFEGQTVPTEMGDANGLIVMGGPMGVYEHARYPHLSDEIRLIERALRDEKPVLGVCLGSQLLAHTLGATVTRSRHKEIGWYPVTLKSSAVTDLLWTGVEQSFTTFHWHGDVFEVPLNAVPLASSDLTACQAFRYGHNAYGFLFHMEVTEQIIRCMVDEFSDELNEVGVDSCQIIEESGEFVAQMQRVGDLVFQRWVEFVERGKE